jgi:glycosyltransferase involved in cell wall biosynthesis
VKIVIPMLGLQRNGGNRVLVAIINALQKQGHECRIMVPGGADEPEFSLVPGMSIVAITPAAGPRWLRWLLFIAVAAIRMRNQKILANHFLTAVAARLAGIGSHARTAYLVQDIEYRFYPPPLSWLARPLCTWTYRLPALLPANQYLRGELERLGFDPQPALHLGVAPIFIDTPLGQDEPRYDLVLFLRRGRHKRLDRYLEIVRLLHARGRRLAAIAPDAALFAPFGSLLAAAQVPRDDGAIMTLLDQSRLLLLASEHEGFALPPLEAMARGLPVVLFPCGGPQVYAVDNENAVYVQDREVATAAELIEGLLEDADRYQRLSANARVTASRYRLDQAADHAARTIAAKLD